MSAKPKQPKPAKPEPCTVCGYRPKSERRPAGDNDFWQCSHVDCPNRHAITAGPGERVPREGDRE